MIRLKVECFGGVEIWVVLMDVLYDGCCFAYTSLTRDDGEAMGEGLFFEKVAHILLIVVESVLLAELKKRF